jgi:hypothetical protein
MNCLFSTFTGRIGRAGVPCAGVFAVWYVRHESRSGAIGKRINLNKDEVAGSIKN